jgi:hypothetical protein
LSLTSCDNDLDLVAGWQEIPVVWGFLNMADTAQYIRVEKAFIDPNIGPLELAQNPDSLYYDNILVELENTRTGIRTPLSRVDGNLEGYPRKEGIFATAPNYLYKVKTTPGLLIADDVYRLIISDESGRVITTAETPMVGQYTLRANSPQNPVLFRYDSSLRITWESLERSAWFYDVKLRLYIQEFEAGNPGNSQLKVLDWQLERGQLRGVSLVTISTFMPGINFYRYLQDQLPVNPNIGRRFISFDIIVDAGARNLFDFFSVSQANAGITGAEFVPAYTNVENGRGLFSSRNRMVAPGFVLSPASADTLKNGIFTKDLNFQ